MAYQVTNITGDVVVIDGNVLNPGEVGVYETITFAIAEALSNRLVTVVYAGSLFPQPMLVSLVVDSTGAVFNPDACVHSFGYAPSGEMITDTATDGTNSWVQTYTYTSGQLTGISKWVKQ